MEEQVLQVSEFVGLLNQTLECAYPYIRVEGEVSSFRVSKNRWVYFDLKDDNSSIRIFGSVYNLNTQIEDGMRVVVSGSPRLHNLYGLSLNYQNIQPVGEGSIKKAFLLLKKKLKSEGLFLPERKRPLPKYPKKIGLLTSAQAAAYGDFIKVANERTGGLEISHVQSGVQGDAAVSELINGLRTLNDLNLDVIVVTRGGGSTDDLAVFSDERVVRAVAESRTPTVVAVGHEQDVSLAELAADLRAATPSNAAQLIIPDAVELTSTIDTHATIITRDIKNQISSSSDNLKRLLDRISGSLRQPLKDVEFLEERLLSLQLRHLKQAKLALDANEAMLQALDPKAVLKRGYSLVRDPQGKVIKNSADLSKGDMVMLELSAGNANAEVKNVKK